MEHCALRVTLIIVGDFLTTFKPAAPRNYSIIGGRKNSPMFQLDWGQVAPVQA